MKAKLELVKPSATISDLVHRLRFAQADFAEVKKESEAVYHKRCDAEQKVIEAQNAIWAALDEAVDR